MSETSRALWRETLNNHPRGLLVTLVATMGVAAVIRSPGIWWLDYWAGASLLLAIVRYPLYLKCKPSLEPGPPPANEAMLVRLHHAGVMGGGLAWAALGWWGMPAFDSSQRLTTLVMLSVLAGGATATLAPMRVGGKAYIALLSLPACVQLFLLGGADNLLLGALGLLFSAVMISTHASNHGLLRHAIELSQDKEDLIRQLSSANSALEARVQERTRSLRDMAQRDLLTGLLNRRGLLVFEQEQAAPDGELLCVFIDLDRFKHINDSHGHDFGDELLKATSARLRDGAAALAQRLQARGHAVCRWGGDEFVLCLAAPACAQPALREAVHALHAALSQPLQVAGLRVQAGLSIGFAACAIGQEQVQDVLGWADLAAAEAKRQGRGRVVMMTDELLRLHRRRLLLLDTLATATLDQSLSLAYQPIVSAVDSQVVALEALLRWNNPRTGPISPAEFIPLAESSDHIINLGQWVLMQACREAAGWPAAPGMAPPRIAINTSIKQLMSSQFIAQLTGVLDTTGLAPTRLVVEVTESVFDECHIEQTLSNLLALKRLGVEIHLDDFGTGYSSLSRLQEFPLHAVKIDKSFVHSHDPRSWTVIEAAVLIAHRFGLRVIAEGIETPQQAEALARLGVDEFQGYWFGRPDPDALRWQEQAALASTNVTNHRLDLPQTE